jgi:hypothetical protein
MKRPKSGPVLGVTGVTKEHAERAAQWLRDQRGVAAFYFNGELCAWESKHGRKRTYDFLYQSLDETRGSAPLQPRHAN